MDTPPDSPEKKVEQNLDRRAFLQRIGKAAISVAPVVAYIASSNRAVAMSGFSSEE